MDVLVGPSLLYYLILQHAERMIQYEERNAALTVESMEHAERIIAHAEMLMTNAERNDVSTVELGGEVAATEIMEHTQKILQHAMQHAAMVMDNREVEGCQYISNFCICALMAVTP